MVWHNPLNDPKKGKDIEANISKLKGEVSFFFFCVRSFHVYNQGLFFISFIMTDDIRLK